MKLPSGAEVRINAADIPESWELLQCLAREGLSIQILGGDEQANVIKNILLASLASKPLYSQLMLCAQKCTYNGLKVEMGVFQDIKAREDMLEVLYLVAEVNLKPFTKSLYARFRDILAQLEKLQSIPA